MEIMRQLKSRWPKVVIIIAYVLAIYSSVQVDHIKDESVELWDVHLFRRYTITYTYDAYEGPIFWFSNNGRTIYRWPKYQPQNPTSLPELYNA